MVLLGHIYVSHRHDHNFLVIYQTGKQYYAIYRDENARLDFGSSPIKLKRLEEKNLEETLVCFLKRNVCTTSDFGISSKYRGTYNKKRVFTITTYNKEIHITLRIGYFDKLYGFLTEMYENETLIWCPEYDKSYSEGLKNSVNLIKLKEDN